MQNLKNESWIGETKKDWNDGLTIFFSSLFSGNYTEMRNWEIGGKFRLFMSYAIPNLLQQSKNKNLTIKKRGKLKIRKM